jgi:hypothetical protein
MKDDISNIKNLWKEAKNAKPTQDNNLEKIIKKADKKKRDTVKLHLINIFILTATLVGISAFFIYIANFKQTISHVGVGLMVGSLSLRILIEFFSVFKSKKIDLSNTAVKSNESALDFYNFRKKIHGPVMITILVLYTIGFYMLTCVFCLFFCFFLMVLIDASYLLGAVIVSFSIRKGIKKEMKNLNEILRLQKDIVKQ